MFFVGVAVAQEAEQVIYQLRGWWSISSCSKLHTKSLGNILNFKFLSDVIIGVRMLNRKQSACIETGE